MINMPTPQQQFAAKSVDTSLQDRQDITSAWASSLEQAPADSMMSRSPPATVIDSSLPETQHPTQGVTTSVESPGYEIMPDLEEMCPNDEVDDELLVAWLCSCHVICLPLLHSAGPT